MNHLKRILYSVSSFSLVVSMLFVSMPITAYAKEDPSKVQVVGTHHYNGEDWWAEAIGAYEAWEHDDESVPVTVGIVDKGVDFTHPEFEGRARALPEYPRNVPAEHGTHVAGLIGAGNNSFGIRGICDKAELLCIDVSKDDGDGLVLTNVLNQIETLLDSGAKVVNCSWGKEVLDLDRLVKEDIPDIKPLWWDEMIGGGFAAMASWYQDFLGCTVYHAVGTDDAYYEYRENLAKRVGMQCAFMIMARLLDNDPDNDDFVIVQTAGNGLSTDRIGGAKGTDVALQGFFASFDEEVYGTLSDEVRRELESRGVTYERIREHIMIVGAVENAVDGMGRYKTTGYSNYGENVDIAAPGGVKSLFGKEKRALLSTVPNGYKALNGTSMAAPLVTGSIAYLLSLDSTLTAAEARQIILDSAETAAGSRHGGPDTYPMLNIGNAVELMEERKNGAAREEALAVPMIRDISRQLDAECITLATAWDPVPQADGYEILYKDKYITDPDWREPEIFTTEAPEFGMSFQDDFDISVRVRAYREAAGGREYGEWSDEIFGNTYDTDTVDLSGYLGRNIGEAQEEHPEIAVSGGDVFAINDQVMFDLNPIDGNTVLITLFGESKYSLFGIRAGVSLQEIRNALTEDGWEEGPEIPASVTFEKNGYVIGFDSSTSGDETVPAVWGILDRDLPKVFDVRNESEETETVREPQTKEDFLSLLPGAWYAPGSSRPSFILYDDGTCEISGEYGLGTWSVVNGNIFKLSNYYSKTETASISGISNGELHLTDGNNTSVFYNYPQ